MYIDCLIGGLFMKYLFYPEEMKYQQIDTMQESVMMALKKRGVNVLISSTFLSNYELDTSLYSRLHKMLNDINKKGNM